VGRGCRTRRFRDTAGQATPPYNTLMLRIAYCRHPDTLRPVTGSSRRIYLYWLLLLLPTLAVAAGPSSCSGGNRRG